MKVGAACWLTAPTSGAIAVFQVQAEPTILAKALSTSLPIVGEASLRNICDLDDALVLRVSDNAILVTPHGGPRLRQRLVRALADAGIAFEPSDQLQSTAIYLETADELESRMLQSLARAASVDAISLLLAQPARWRKHGPPQASDLPRSMRLCRLVHPPTVVLAGAPNAGKSTLFNALVGRTAAVASPIAGTTRDFVSAKVVLAGLTCRIVDAPGFAQSKDAIEQTAIARVQRELAQADLVVALASPNQGWPDLHHDQVLRVRTMCDLPQSIAHKSGDLRVSAQTGEGLIDFAKTVREILVPAADVSSDRPWQFFSPNFHKPMIE